MTKFIVHWPSNRKNAVKFGLPSKVVGAAAPVALSEPSTKACNNIAQKFGF